MDRREANKAIADAVEAAIGEMIDVRHLADVAIDTLAGVQGLVPQWRSEPPDSIGQWLSYVPHEDNPRGWIQVLRITAGDLDDVPEPEDRELWLGPLPFPD